jgi:hypothetical protein
MDFLKGEASTAVWVATQPCTETCQPELGSSVTSLHSKRASVSWAAPAGGKTCLNATWPVYNNFFCPPVPKIRHLCFFLLLQGVGMTLWP